jgi:hypothetical protein
MTTQQLITILKQYPDSTEVLVSLGMDEPHMRTVVGVREGALIKGTKPVLNRSQHVTFDDSPTTIAAILA